MESDGRPRGSFNRWNYNEVYRPATPSSGSDGARDTGAGSWDTGVKSQNGAADTHYHRWRQSQRLRTFTTLPPPTPGRHVELDAKHDVDWAYDSMSFYLRVSAVDLTPCGISFCY